jgi:hypothetical protein
MLTRARSVAVAVVWTCFTFGAVGAPPGVAAVSPSAGQLSADLDGKPMALADVGNWFCHDFASPKIHCYSSSMALEAAVAPILSTATDNYVVVFDQPTFAGSYMYMSQDYTVLALIGWNDRISSFVGLNNESGHFFTDWFYGGSYWYFFGNDQTPYLGSYDNTFSSVHRG